MKPWILALTLLLATAAFPAPSTAQVGSTADLAVTQVRPNEPVVGAEKQIEATVRNNGPDTVFGFDVLFSLNEEGKWVNGNQDASRDETDGSQKVLAPGESTTVTLSWEPREGQAGAALLIATLEEDQDREDPDPDNDRDQSSTFVTLPGVEVAPSWTSEPESIELGAQRALPFHVRNTGNVEATYVAELTEPDAEGWSVALSPEEADLAPGDEAQFALTVQAPDDAEAGERINESRGLDLRIVEQGYENSTRGVAEPVVPEIVVSPTRSLELTIEDPEPRKPSTTVTATLTIHNEGNTDETVELDRSTTQGDLPEDWSVDYVPREIDVPAFSTDRNVTLELEIPKGARAGDYELVTVATGQGGSLPPTDTGNATITVQQIHELSVTPGTTELSLFAAEEGRVTFTVNNTGNGEDNVTIATEPPASDWTVEPTPKERALGPGEEQTFRVRVAPPAQAPPTQDERLGLVVETPGGEVSKSLEASIDVKSGPNLHLANVPEAPRLDPSTGLTMLLNVVNGGNEQGSATVDTSIADGWSVSQSRDTFEEMPEGETQNLRLTVQAPQGAVPGDKADLEVSVIHQGKGPDHDPVTIPVTVGGPDLKTKILSAPAKVGEGTEQELTVRVTSQGLTGAEATTLELVAQGNKGSQTLGTFQIPRLATGDQITRTATWNTTGWADNVLLTARVDPGGGLTEENEVNNEHTANVFVATLDASISTPPPMTVDPSQRVQLTTAPLAVTVTNEGNDANRFRVQITDEGDWFAKETQISLGAGETSTVPLSFTVPRPTGRLVDNVTVAVSQPGENATFTAGWTISVRDVAPPRVTELNLTEPVAWGVEETHTILFDEGTAVRDGTVRITGPNGTASETPVVPVGPDKARFTWTPEDLGEHDIVITLVDLAGNSAPSRSLDANVTPPDPPTIEAPENLHVAPGTPVPVTINSDAPLDTVTAEARGLRQTLTPPFRVNTSGWAEGEATVNVEASNRIGQSANATFTLTIDATPPTLVSSSIDPSSPDAGEDVTVQLTFNETMESASVVLVGSDGERNRYNATSLSPERFESTFPWPRTSVDRIDVQATDAAGVATVIEGGVELSTSPIPALGPLAVLALAGAAAHVLRRRPSP